MTAISAHDLCFVAPAGMTLIHPLQLELPRACHGLVGRNGAGKSVLARMLAGQLAPSSGHVVRHAPVGFLPQSPTRGGRCMADALGIGARLAALARIEAGGSRAEDFELIDGDWCLAERWRQALAEAGLPTDLTRDTATLSGGELTRLLLLPLFADGSRYLILDEPTNHLDMAARRWLGERLRAHRGGSLLVSHDRNLLDQVDTIHALSASGLRTYGGNWAHYQTRRDEDATAAHAQVDHARRALQAARRDQQLAVQRQQKRQRRGQRDDNLPAILAGRRRQQAEQSLGQLHRVHAERVAMARARVHASAGDAGKRSAQRIDVPDRRSPRAFAMRAQALQLPHGHAQPIDLALPRDGRLHVQGDNGVGKSCLLAVLAGQRAPAGGALQLGARQLLVDQHFSLLQPRHSALANLAAVAPSAPEDRLRTLLAGIGLEGDRAHTLAGDLSGGERVRLALLVIDAASEPYELLLLDEPDNHLDIEAKQLLEAALHDYAGAIVLVSHDPLFVQAVGVDAVLRLEK